MVGFREAKDNIKDYQEKYLKQDRFIRTIHEKILFLESLILKMKEPKQPSKEIGLTTE